MIKQILNILFCVLTLNCAYSQNNIRGLLLDDKTSEVIPFAYVTLTNGKEIITQTDFDGKFEFQNVNTDSVLLKVSYAGYSQFDSIIKSDNKNNELTIKLVPDSTMKYDILISSYNKKGALQDIQKGDIKLLLPGGIVGSPELSTDSIFEVKYNVSFISQGCVRFPEENEKEYNLEIFKYLDENYGTDWRKEIRADVIGLKN